MPISFPTNPTANQVFSVGSITYTWNGTSWSAQDMAGAPTAASTLTVSDGSNTIVGVTQINFSNASVFLGGGGGTAANVTPVFTVSGAVQVVPTQIGIGTSNTISFSVANTFNSIEIHINGLVPNTTPQTLNMQINGDGGNNYRYHGRYGLSNNSSDSTFNADPTNAFYLTTSSNSIGGGRIIITNVQNSYNNPPFGGVRVQWWLDYIDAATGKGSSIQGGGYWASTGPLTSLVLNYTYWSGRVSLWGWLGE